MDKIVLNSMGLQLSDVCLKSDSDEEITQVGQVVLDAANEQAVIPLASFLQPGIFCLKMSFHGTIVLDKPNGFYSNKYLRYTNYYCILLTLLTLFCFSSDGEERFNAVTQFEPTFARRAFPCWDEPALRATFSIELIVPKDRVALSNMVM